MVGDGLVALEFQLASATTFLIGAAMELIPQRCAVELYRDTLGNLSISLVSGGIPITTVTLPPGEETDLRHDLSMLYADEIPPYIHRMGTIPSIAWRRGKSPFAVVAHDWSVDGDLGDYDIGA